MLSLSIEGLPSREEVRPEHPDTKRPATKQATDVSIATAVFLIVLSNHVVDTNLTFPQE